MNIHETAQKLDELLHHSQLDDAELFLIESIAQADLEHDTESEKYLLNEQIGFYRDCGKFPDALKACDRVLDLFRSSGEANTVSYATTLLNCANAYRAAGKSDDAFAAFEEVRLLYSRLLPENDHRIASFYNNLALLYQETDQWENACVCLEKALKMVRSDNDNTRIAVSCTNLAVSLLRLNRTDEALGLLNEANALISGLSPSDFHYSAVLAGLGDAFYQLGQYNKAVDYYEQALSEIELHMGRNNFYDIVSDNLLQAYAGLGMSERPAISGMELAKKFYFSFGEPMLKRNFSEIYSHIAIGLAGEGSECLGYDDEISRDHDYGAGFCIWVPDDFPETILNSLKQAYDLLPKTYMGVSRVQTQHSSGRVGVCRIGEFFSRILSMNHIPENQSEWLTADENMLAAACSGEIFADDSGYFSELRETLKKGYPESVRLRRLAQELALMAQSGQYNYFRMRQRGDIPTAQIYLAKFCISAMKAAHLCKKVYAPYDKWLLKSTKSLTGFEIFADEISELLTLNPSENINCFDILIKQICNKIVQEVLPESMDNNIYLNDAAEKLSEMADKLNLVNRIVELEWQAFDKVQNIGGRASCQDDWETFSIMRSSQYKNWTVEMLRQWCSEFETAYRGGRNLITEKYARMMESTEPERYAGLSNELPELSEEFIKIREAVVAIQVSCMDDFAENYPKLAANARTVHTENDTLYQTSYETYLRGELSTYSFEMLYTYARWITQLAKTGKNIAFMIMTETVHAYGYKDLDDAESKL